MQISKNAIESVYLNKINDFWFVEFTTISGKDIPHLSLPLKFNNENEAKELYLLLAN